MVIEKAVQISLVNIVNPSNIVLFLGRPEVADNRVDILYHGGLLRPGLLCKASWTSGRVQTGTRQ